MINANIKLKAILCHATEEQDSGAEPYMWTSFFYLDTRTWFGPGKKLVSYTPHADWTTRGVFPDGIRAKDTPGDAIRGPDAGTGHERHPGKRTPV